MIAVPYQGSMASQAVVVASSGRRAARARSMARAAVRTELTSTAELLFTAAGAVPSAVAAVAAVAAIVVVLVVAVASVEAADAAC